MTSKRTGERMVDYLGTSTFEIVLIPVNFALVGGASLLVGERVDASFLALLFGAIITYVISVPLTLEFKYLVQGKRPFPPYTVTAVAVGDMVGRPLAGAIGFGLLLRPNLTGALLGALAGLIVAAIMLIWLKPWDKEAEEDLARRSELLREELGRNR